MAPVVFVVEELDLFAQHPKQSLLYNLFDLTQTSGSSLFVLGVTSKMVRLCIPLYIFSPIH